MPSVRLAVVAVTLVSLAAPGVAAANPSHRVELDAAFLAGQRSYGDVPFSYTEGTASPALSPPRLAGIEVTGPALGGRVVVRGVRLGAGWERTYFSGFTGQPSATSSSTTSIRALEARAYSLTMGYELDGFFVTPFVDLVGTAEHVIADLEAGDTQSSFDSSVFGYSARAGARVAFTRHWFFQVSGETGLYGPIDWSVHAGIGVGVGDAD